MAAAAILNILEVINWVTELLKITVEGGGRLNTGNSLLILFWYRSFKLFKLRQN